MIPKPFYTRLAHVELAMEAAQGPAVVWLPSCPPTVAEWEHNLARLDAERGPRGIIGLPTKATSIKQWARECHAVWPMEGGPR